MSIPKSELPTLQELTVDEIALGGVPLLACSKFMHKYCYEQSKVRKHKYCSFKFSEFSQVLPIFMMVHIIFGLLVQDKQSLAFTSLLAAVKV